MITSIGKDRALRLMARVRRPELPKSEFLQFFSLVRVQPDDSADVFPFAFDSWMPVIMRSNLDNSIPLVEWLGAMRWMSGKLLANPADLFGLFTR